MRVQGNGCLAWGAKAMGWVGIKFLAFALGGGFMSAYYIKTVG